MLNSYQRRAFVLLAIAALEPVVASPARAAETAPGSLWDILSSAPYAGLPQTDSLQTIVNNGSNSGGTLPQAAPRRSLGPVPGFTIPGDPHSAHGGDSLFAKNKKNRGGLFGTVGDWFDRMQAATGSKIKASGHHTMSFRMEHVSGSDSAYHDEQYYGRGSNGIYSDTDLTLDATMFKYFHYQTRISNSLFNNPNDNRVKLDYNTKSTHLEWGDINAGFQGNSLIDFNRYLHGIQYSQQWTKNFRSTLLYSQTKAETRTITVPGNDSAGPYYVYAGQIVEGSDHVRIDNRDMVKGQDYTLDTYTGELSFLRGNIVLHTSTIAVTFETLGYNQSSGNIYGFRSELIPRPGSTFGMTYVTQQAQSNSGLQTHTQQFNGYGTPGAAYNLDSPVDQTKPIIVTVDGLPLVQNKDFIVNAVLTNQILITSAVDPHSLISVQYVPLGTTQTPGNRSVIGMDGRFSLGKLGFVTAETALSSLSLTGNNIAGKAAQIRADLNLMRGMHTVVTLRDVGNTFSSIQSPGFNRNEKSLDLTGEYTPTRNLRFNYNWQKAKRPSYTASSNDFSVSTNGNDTYDQYSLGVNYTFARNAVLSLSRNSLGTQYILGGNSKNLNDSLTLSYGLRSVTFEAALSHNVNTSNSYYNYYTDPNASAPTSQLSVYDSAATSKRLGIRWQAAHWLNLSGSVSDNAISNYGGGLSSRTNARDSQLSANFSLIRNLRLNYTYSLSDTGSPGNALTTGTTPTTTPTTTTTGSTSTGTTGSGSILGTTVRSAVFAPLSSRITRDITSVLGGGTNNNLGSSGNYGGLYGNTGYTGYGATSFGGKSTSNRISLDYQPRRNMQIGLQLDNSGSNGDYQYNSTRNNYNLNFGWQPSDRLQINATYGLQKVLYVGNYGGTNSKTMLLSIQGRPFGGKLGTQLSWQSLQTSSTVNFGTSTTGTTPIVGTTPTPTDTGSNLNSLSLRLDHPIFRSQTLFFELLKSSSSGYYGSTENDMRVGVDFALTQALKFSLGWQTISRINKDVANQAYNYSASSVLAELGLRF